MKDQVYVKLPTYGTQRIFVDPHLARGSSSRASAVRLFAADNSIANLVAYKSLSQVMSVFRLSQNTFHDITSLLHLRG
jgi:pyocin large subunit-like protein